jgi:hypothetical protein
MLQTKRLECFIRSLAITPGQLVAPENQRPIEHVTEELWRNYNTRTRIMGRNILLWILGVPVSVIVLLHVVGLLH